MQVMDALGDPVRRRLVELLSVGARSAGTLADAVGAEVGMVESTVDGQRRVYALRREPLDEVEDWLRGLRAFWDQRLDALDTDLRRGSTS